MIHYLQDGSISIGFMVKSAFFKRLKTIVSVIQDLYNGEVKGIKSLGVKPRTWFLEHSKKQSIQMKIYQNSLYILIKVFYTNPLNIVITLRKHHLLNPWVPKEMLMIMQFLKVSSGRLNAKPSTYKRLNRYLI